MAAIVTVNEARTASGLPDLALPDGSPDPDGGLTIAEFKAKHIAVVADAAAASEGEKSPALPPTAG